MKNRWTYDYNYKKCAFGKWRVLRGKKAHARQRKRGKRLAAKIERRDNRKEIYGQII